MKPDDAVLKSLMEILHDFEGWDTTDESIGPDRTLRQMGLDSLDTVDLVVEIEDHFLAEFSNPLPGPDSTPRQLAEQIEKYLNKNE